MQRRTEIKDFYPGWLDATAGGVVQSGENVLDSARREAEEELGIAGVPFAEHGLFYFEEEQCRVGGAVQLRIARAVRAAGRRSGRGVLADAGRDHRPLRRVYPDSLKALSLWLTRNNEQDYGKPLDNH
ncbi:NUDIX domain-containing protein [Serratia ureilytica]